MKMIKRSGKRCLATAISLALTSYAPVALPLGLGGASVQSRIGEPLLAEIPILDGSRDYQANEILVRQVRGRLAQQLGFDLAADAPTYFLKVIEENGRLVLLVRSKRTMSEPFVSVLVELEWPNGKLYRDYNLLLDLAPLSVDVPVASAVAHSISNQVDSPSVQQDAATNSRSGKSASSFAVSSSPGAAAAAVNPAQSTADGWRVDGGDTLSQIAQKIRPDDQIKLTAVVEALFQLNPQAFLNGDINRMQGGSLLKLPSPEQYAVMPRWDGGVGVSPSSGPTIKPLATHSTTPQQAQARAYQGSTSPHLPATPRPSQLARIEEKAAASESKVTHLEAEAESSELTQSLEDYIIRPGDTLSQVAQKLRRDPRVRLQDMMRLLYDSNPQAFVNGDMNRLQLGASLSVPNHGSWSAPTVQSLAQAESQRQPAEQAPEAVDETADLSTDPVSDHKPESATENQSLDATQPEISVDSQTARLILSSSEGTNGSLNEQGSSAQQILHQIDAVAELVDKVNRENQAIRQRIERIEHSEQLALLERLLELQTRQIQNLRQAMVEQSAVSENDGQAQVFAVEGADATVVQRLGRDGLVANAEAKLLEEHLRNAGQAQMEPALINDSSKTQIPSDALSKTESPSGVEGSEPGATQEPQVILSTSLVVSAILTALMSLVAWLLIFRRRPLYQWLNKKLNLFEQNSEEASLPRVWDPEVGAWRVREDIRKPVLTPLETSLDDIESALQRHNERHGQLSDTDISPLSTEADSNVNPSTLQDRLAAQEKDDQEKQAQAVAPVVQSSQSNHHYNHLVDTQDIDSMFEELSPEALEIGTPNDEATFSKQDRFPLLNDVAERVEPSDTNSEEFSSDEFQIDNLDGEFDFSLPDELFEPPANEDLTPKKPVSEADARVKAAIVEKTKNYDPESLDEALDNWLGGSIPAPEISEYEDVISEAMIYAAYGRHEHAKQLLLEQITLNPDEPELQTALAEVQKSASQFKGGKGFGDLKGNVDGAGSSLELPSKPDAFEGLTLDLDGHPSQPKD